MFVSLAVRERAVCVAGGDIMVPPRLFPSTYVGTFLRRLCVCANIIRCVVSFRFKGWAPDGPVFSFGTSVTWRRSRRSLRRSARAFFLGQKGRSCRAVPRRSSRRCARVTGFRRRARRPESYKCIIHTLRVPPLPPSPLLPCWLLLLLVNGI